MVLTGKNLMRFKGGYRHLTRKVRRTRRGGTFRRSNKIILRKGKGGSIRVVSRRLRTKRNYKRMVKSIMPETKFERE